MPLLTYLFYEGAAGMPISALLTSSQCTVSDTQMTVKTLWPLISRNLESCHHIEMSLTFKLFCYHPLLGEMCGTSIDYILIICN